MRNKVVVSVALCSLSLLLGRLLPALAQNPPGGSNKQDERTSAPTASRFDDDANPESVSPSGVQFKINGQSVRYAGISPQAKTSPHYVRGLRFAKPLLALVERNDPIEPGLPAVIDDIERTPDGSVWLQFRVAVSTPDFLRRCRDAVLAQERDLLKGEHLTEQDIRIEPWPLKHCVVTAKHPITGRIVGVGQTDTLTGTRDEFTFSMAFESSELREVFDLIKTGRLAFVYSYSYVGRTEYKGSVDLKGVKDAKIVASQKLQSKQKGEPIFQAEANEAVRHVMMSIERTTRANHADLLPLLNQPGQFDALFQKLFADDGAINLSELKKGQDEATAEMVAAYLKPHLEQVRESLGADKKYLTINDERNSKSTTTTPPTVSVGLGAVIPAGPIALLPSIGISKSLGDPETKTEEILKRVEQATGTSWTQEMNSEKYRPHKIAKFKFQGGAEQVLINDQNTVFLAVARSNGYLEDTPVPVKFTTKALGSATRSNAAGDLGPYEGVPIGVMLPYFGVTPPKGYVWADGQAHFPNGDWVPIHLRGAAVPDMREHLIGGARDEANAGVAYRQGKLEIKGATIDGSSFYLPAPTSYRIAAGDGGRKKEGGFVVILNHNGNYDGEVAWTGFGASGENGFGWGVLPRPAIYSSFPQGTKLEGSKVVDAQTIALDNASTLPQHVMCRWIVRVE